MELIERQIAIDAVEKESQVDGAYGYMDTKSIVNLLNNLPSITQPEIIRCQDCKYYKPYKYDGILACHYIIDATVRRNSDDFCSRAERKNDE